MNATVEYDIGTIFSEFVWIDGVKLGWCLCEEPIPTEFVNTNKHMLCVNCMKEFFV